MVSFKECLKRKEGIKLIEPNEVLAQEYIHNAEETLAILKEIGGKSSMWLATTKYYFEYFCVYSVLMKLGIKSEIHDCTIEVCRYLEEKNILDVGFTRLLEKDKQLRIDNQYYLKNTPVFVDYSELTSFLFRVKEILRTITHDQIKTIRAELL
jgi:uncharacterized protein (UPF0332 family)